MFAIYPPAKENEIFIDVTVVPVTITVGNDTCIFKH